MDKKLTGKTLAKFESKRDVWQEVLDGVREIKAGGGVSNAPWSNGSKAAASRPALRNSS
jgi:putative transcriptional regulator